MRRATSSAGCSWLPMAAIKRLSSGSTCGPSKAGLEILEQLLHGEQRVDLLRAEPQPGQLLQLRLRIEAVAVVLAIPDDRDVQPRAQVLQIALEGGGGDFELVANAACAHHLVTMNELLNLIEALGAIHAQNCNSSRRARGLDSGRRKRAEKNYARLAARLSAAPPRGSCAIGRVPTRGDDAAFGQADQRSGCLQARPPALSRPSGRPSTATAPMGRAGLLPVPSCPAAQAMAAPSPCRLRDRW